MAPPTSTHCLHQAPPNSSFPVCVCAQRGCTTRRGTNHGKWPRPQLRLQYTLLHTAPRRTPPTTPWRHAKTTTPVGTNPSPHFTLRHLARHPSPTTPCCPTPRCPTPSVQRMVHSSLPNTLHAALHQAHIGGTPHARPAPYATCHPPHSCQSHHTPAWHVWERRHKTHTMDIKRGVGVT